MKSSFHDSSIKWIDVLCQHTAEKRLRAEHWCHTQESPGKFYVAYSVTYNILPQPTHWTFQFEADAIMFKLRWG